MDEHRAAVHLSDQPEHRDHRREEDEVGRDPGRRERAELLRDHVVDEERDEDEGDAEVAHRLRGRPPGRPVGFLRASSHPVDDREQEEAGDPGPRRAPAEPVERAGPELGDDRLLDLGGDLALEAALHEVEEVEVADPEDAEEDVRPAQEQVDVLHRVVGLRDVLGGQSRGEEERAQDQKDRGSRTISSHDFSPEFAQQRHAEPRFPNESGRSYQGSRAGGRATCRLPFPGRDFHFRLLFIGRSAPETLT